MVDMFASPSAKQKELLASATLRTSDITFNTEAIGGPRANPMLRSINRKTRTARCFETRDFVSASRRTA
jgi:hypothetical protein